MHVIHNWSKQKLQTCLIIKQIHSLTVDGAYGKAEIVIYTKNTNNAQSRAALINTNIRHNMNHMAVR